MAIRPRPRSTRLLVVTLVSVSLAVITLDYRGGTTGPLASLGRTAKAGIAPLQAAVTDVTRPVANFFVGVANLPSLADENRTLREEVQELRTRNASFAFQQQLQEELENLVGLQELHPRGVAALVTANGVSNFEWTVTINRGSNDGIALDMPVIAGSPEAARLVGKVIDVTLVSAEVQLILDRESAVWAVIDGSREAGLVWGRGDQDLVMDQVDEDARIVGDENVFTQGYEVNGQRGVYPPGLLIGQIARVSPEDNALDTPITVRPAVDFSALNVVLVLQTRSTDPEAVETETATP